MAGFTACSNKQQLALVPSHLTPVQQHHGSDEGEHVTAGTTSLCLHGYRCAWVEPVAVSQYFREELFEKNLLLSPAASSDGETHLDTASSQSQAKCHLSISELTCLSLCPQVNLIPGLMEAFSDAGGDLCHFYSHSHLTGESEESQLKEHVQKNPRFFNVYLS